MSSIFLASECISERYDMTGSVLILGAGVAGMRAAVELLQQGFKVYLLEEGPTIPANMARIQQLFPANEDAACALQPIMLDLLNNPNATILTSSELLSLQGRAGDFTVEILRKQAEGDERPSQLELAVGVVIVPARLEDERDEFLERLGYGRFPNVLTGFEFERKFLRLESTGGIIRLTNGRELGRVAWLVRKEDSPESFMSATAQALGVREMNKHAQVSILYEKRLTDGKGCEGCCREAERQGVNYIQASSVEVGHTQVGKLVLFYTTEDGKRAQLETELLILPISQVPNDKTRTLAERLGLELDENRYFRKDSMSGHPVLSSREGVFLYGTVHGAKGIGESIIQACATAAHAAVLLAPARGNGLDESAVTKLFPVKATDEPKIAVVIDQNGTEATNLLNWNELGEYTRTLPGVECVEVTSCASDGTKIRELLSTGNFNRLVVAGPSPIPYEPRFQRYAEQAGLNRYL
ncbi:MAG: FAD-dependent oxidoreductase, partial [candidate division KSB1 bacterium]|nr:FAD-dependent oxidoreductase [candidate division KSB1 bacterium]